MTVRGKIPTMKIIGDKLNLHFICHTEHWQNKENIEKLAIQNNTLLTADQPKKTMKTTYRGASIYCRDEITENCLPIKIPKSILRDKIFECVGIKYNKNNLNTIFCIYKNPHKHPREKNP